MLTIDQTITTKRFIRLQCVQERNGEKIHEGEIVKGKVTRIKHFGAFVEVYPCVEALLPQSEVMQYQNEHNTILDVGEVIDTVILKFNPDDKRISLSVNINNKAK